MFISRTQIQNILKIYGKVPGSNKVNKGQSGQGLSTNDQLALSPESKIKQKAVQAAKQSEDIRQDKVEELKERISTGTYTVADDQVAEKIIDTAILDRLV